MNSDNTFLENFYNEYDEDGRPASNRLGRVEYLTTRRFLDPLLTADCKIAEIGAGTGRIAVKDVSKTANTKLICLVSK